MLITQAVLDEPDRRWRIYTSVPGLTIDLISTASEIDDALEKSVTDGAWLRLPSGQRINPRHVVAVDPLE